MKNLSENKTCSLWSECREPAAAASSVDILILSDGTILVHNLTPAMATMLNAINPHDATMKPRAVPVVS